MPMRPPTPCSVFGCPHKKPCPNHPAKSWVVDPTRGTVAERGYGERHRQWRKRILARDPFCRYRFAGCTVRATVADHVVRIAEGGARFDLANGQGACAHCHNVKTQRESIDARKNLVKDMGGKKSGAARP